KRKSQLVDLRHHRLLGGVSAGQLLLVQTSFVPDEYWQSLEVSTTWTGLRGFIYPLFFASIYKTLHFIGLDSVTVLIWFPRVMQALLASAADVKMYFFTRSMENPRVAKWTYFCQLCSWFTWYCCTRTLSNTMETTLTSLALTYYPLPGSKAHHRSEPLQAGVCILTPPPVPLSADYKVLSEWTLVQYNFLRFNVLHGSGRVLRLAPLALVPQPGLRSGRRAHLPFFLHGCSLASRRYRVLLVTIRLDPHGVQVSSEFRFIYPVLPFCMLFCGMSLAHLKARRRAAAGVLLVANLLPALYTGLVHQRGALDVMTRLQELCEPPGPAGSPSPEVLFLMPCHSTPYYSHVHCPLRMRFLECPPDLGGAGYSEEARVFYQDPLHWLSGAFPDRAALPTHLVLFDVLEKDISGFLESNKFTRTAEIFHSHFPEGRVGGNILVYERRVK
uniref:Mannosyltransferase n=1 Tax=Gadus morhua TaxID=8049 RepID=A0A8C4YY76_GADMO